MDKCIGVEKTKLVMLGNRSNFLTIPCSFAPLNYSNHSLGFQLSAKLHLQEARKSFPP